VFKLIIPAVLVATGLGGTAVAGAIEAICPSGEMNATQYGGSGRHPAGGQPTRLNGHTAAHRTLPFGTSVRVTNPRTGASTVVIINDRGPFTHGRDIDLSRRAARAIGLRSVGRSAHKFYSSPARALGPDRGSQA
jgi:rare lipoprotein A (peptidoglycan hydrolase)